MNLCPNVTPGNHDNGQKGKIFQNAQFYDLYPGIKYGGLI